MNRMDREKRGPQRRGGVVAKQPAQEPEEEQDVRSMQEKVEGAPARGAGAEEEAIEGERGHGKGPVGTGLVEPVPVGLAEERPDLARERGRAFRRLQFRPAEKERVVEDVVPRDRGKPGADRKKGEQARNEANAAEAHAPSPSALATRARARSVAIRRSAGNPSTSARL